MSPDSRDPHVDPFGKVGRSRAGSKTPMPIAPSTARRVVPSLVTWALVAFVTFLVLYPLLALAVKPLGQVPALWDQALEIPHLGKTLVNTVVLGLGSTILATAVALILAWCRANLGGRGGSFAQIVALLPLMIPPISGVIGWAFLLSPQVGYLNVALRHIPFLGGDNTGPFNIYSLPWIVIITGIYLIPYVFVFIQVGLANIDPRLEDSARGAGSGWWGVQFRIVLPLLRPALIYGGGLVGLLALGQFTAPLLLGRTQGIDVLTTELYRLTVSPPPDYELATFVALPILFLAFIGIAIQRRALRSDVRFAMSGKGTSRARASNRLLLVPIIIYSFLVVIPPLVGLVLVSLSPYWGGTIDFDHFSLAAFQEVLQSEFARRAILNSVWFSVIATVCCLALSLGAALVALRGPKAARPVVDYLVNIPVAVPAILFGMGIFTSFGLGPITTLTRDWFGIDLYGSALVIIVAYVVLVLPHGTRLAMSGLAQINPQLEAAARVSGSTTAGSVIRILLPLLRRNLVSAAMLMFVLSSHEFAASSLLVSPDTQVMSTLLYGEWESGTYPRVAAIALIMVGMAVVSLALIGLADRSRKTDRPSSRKQS